MPIFSRLSGDKIGENHLSESLAGKMGGKNVGPPILSAKFFPKCHRSATSMACGAPFLMAAAYSEERSRLTISTLGCFSNHAETVSTDRSAIMRDFLSFLSEMSKELRGKPLILQVKRH